MVNDKRFRISELSVGYQVMKSAGLINDATPWNGPPQPKFRQITSSTETASSLGLRHGRIPVYHEGRRRRRPVSS
jgi:hypothetical protein